MKRTRHVYYTIRKAGLYSSFVVIPVAGAYYKRPLPDFSTGDWGGPSHYTPKTVTKSQNERRLNPYFSKEAMMERELMEQKTAKNVKKGEEKSIQSSYSNTASGDFFEKVLDMGYNVSRYIVLNSVNLVIKLGMNSSLYNTFRCVQDERYQYLLSSINSRSKDEALLTVSNHCSTIDDPTLIGAILPATIVTSPLTYDKIRWTLCSQEICFKNDVVSTIFGAGKVLPIKRGGGISQPLLHAFALKIAACDWVHIFPEGKIIQSGTLGANYFGTRKPKRAKKIGKLKWGVGKLIAHSSVPIRVIPFHHVGMEGIIPQKKTGETIYKHPLGGCDVKARVGKRIFFDDIIEEYEEKYGKLYKYGNNTDGDASALMEDREQWKKSGEKDHELALYSRITRRIEDALEELERESKKDHDMTVQKTYAKLTDDM